MVRRSGGREGAALQGARAANAASLVGERAMSTPSDRSSAVDGQLSPSFLVLVYLNAFITGAVVMGFEMLGSRYLNPLFGSGIYTWAALISTVLASLTAGYFFGGWIADRNPRPAGLGWLIVAGSAYLALIPLFAEPLLDALSQMLGGIEDQREFERWGSILGAMLLLFVPLALLGVYSPYAIRLTLRATARSGTVAGRIYGISTLGSIFGTLFTTFYLIPAMGSRNITYLLSAIGIAAGFSFLIARPAAFARALPAAAGALLLMAALALPQEAVAENPRSVETPREGAVPAQASGREAADRFIAYLRKNTVEVSHGAIEAVGPNGFRIEGLKITGRDKDEWRVASLQAASFEERANGETAATGLAIRDLEATGPDKTVVKIGTLAAESLAWAIPPADPRAALRGLAAREIAVTQAKGTTVRVASVDLANFRYQGQGGELERLAVRAISSTGAGESGSLGAIDVERVTVALPDLVSVKNVVLRDFTADTAPGATVRVASAELRTLEIRGLINQYTADFRALEFAFKGVEIPLRERDGSERELRALGYEQIKLNAEYIYRYEEAGKIYDLRKLEIDVIDAAGLLFALKLSGPSPDEVRKALTPPPAVPGQPDRSRDNAAALGLMAQFNLLSADLSLKDKSLIGRLLKREAEKRQTTVDAIKTEHLAALRAVRDSQTDPLVREALDAVIAFYDDPGELVVEIRPPSPLNVMAIAGVAASNPAQLRAMLGLKITTKRP
jgi:hypothetical protein